MGRHPTGQRKYEIEHIWELHREIVRRLVLGQKPKDIARDLGVTTQTVSNVRNSSIVQQEIKKLSDERDKEVKDVSAMIKELAPRAVAVLEEVLKDRGARPGDRIRAAADILDRAGHGAVRRVEALHAHLTPQDIDEITRRGQDIARSVGLVDATLIEEDEEKKEAS